MTKTSTADRESPPVDILAANNLRREAAREILGEAVAGGDDGELYFEHRKSESLLFDNGRLKAASYDTSEGFGLRVVAGEAVGYAHSSEISQGALRRAGAAAAAAKRGYSGQLAPSPARSNRHLYTDASPLEQPDFAAKATLLAEIDAYARGLDPRVRQVSVSLAGEWQSIEILRADGAGYLDHRPLVRLSVSIVAEQDGRQESGSSGGGGRVDFSGTIDGPSWRFHADEALRRALDAALRIRAEMERHAALVGRTVEAHRTSKK